MDDNVLQFPDLGDGGPEEPLVLEFTLDVNRSPEIIIEFLIKLSASVAAMERTFAAMMAVESDVDVTLIQDHYHKVRKEMMAFYIDDLKKRYPPP